jgi:hypothetical protein
VSGWQAFYDEYGSGAINIYVQKGTDEATRELHSSIPAELDDDPEFNPDFDKLMAAACQKAAWLNAEDERAVIEAGTRSP